MFIFYDKETYLDASGALPCEHPEINNMSKLDQSMVDLTFCIPNSF